MLKSKIFIMFIYNVLREWYFQLYVIKRGNQKVMFFGSALKFSELLLSVKIFCVKKASSKVLRNYDSKKQLWKPFIKMGFGFWVMGYYPVGYFRGYWYFLLVVFYYNLCKGVSKKYWWTNFQFWNWCYSTFQNWPL